MLQYAICELKGKQYKIIPDKAVEVDFFGESNLGQDIEANVMLLSEEGKIQIGKPYLKQKLILKRVENTQGKKIRVAKFHAKANFRKVTGTRRKFTKVILAVKKAS